MSTGLTSLTNLAEIGAEYPFHGFEMVFTLILLGFFALFFVWQVAMETKHHSAIIGNFTASPEVKSMTAEPVSYESAKLATATS